MGNVLEQFRIQLGERFGQVGDEQRSKKSDFEVYLAKKLVDTIVRELQEYEEEGDDEISDANSCIEQLEAALYDEVAPDDDDIPESVVSASPEGAISLYEATEEELKSVSKSIRVNRNSSIRHGMTEEQRDKFMAYVKDHPNHRVATLRSKFRFLADRADRTILQIRKEALDGVVSKREIWSDINQLVALQILYERDQHAEWIHDIDIQLMLEQAAVDVGLEEYRASQSTVTRLKRRFGFSSRKVSKYVVRKTLVDLAKKKKEGEDFVKATVKEIEELGIDPRDLGNCDQVGCNYEMICKRTISKKGEKTTFGKVQSENGTNNFSVLDFLYPDHRISSGTLP